MTEKIKDFVEHELKMLDYRGNSTRQEYLESFQKLTTEVMITY